MLDRIWLGISDLYATKRYMRLSGMQLTDFVCQAKWQHRSRKKTADFELQYLENGKTYKVEIW